MYTDFPTNENKFIKASTFQDQEIPLTFLGWDKKANDDLKTSKGVIKWEDRLIYTLRYSFPEMAINPQTGQQRVDKNGQPFQNKYFDPAYPKGYSIVYHFEEGVLESGSLPLFEAFCLVRPKAGETLVIGKTGRDKETKWTVRRASSNVHAQTTDCDDVPTIQIDESNFEQEPETTPF